MELRRKLTRDTSMQSHLQKLPPMAANLRRDDDDTTTTDDDRRRETTRDDDKRRHDAGHANTCPTPTPPTINGNPSLRIREKGFDSPKMGLTHQKGWRFQHRSASLRRTNPTPDTAGHCRVELLPLDSGTLRNQARLAPPPGLHPPKKHIGSAKPLS